MTENNFYIIDTKTSEFENHIPQSSEEHDFPFEFSHTNMWNQSFLPPENRNLPFEELKNELKCIGQILSEIKDFLTNTFK